MILKHKTALISVYQKDGITPFVKELVALGWQIFSSGGTATFLKASGIEVVDTADITGLKAILGHRVATLHPKIHGGLLALDTPDHLRELIDLEIPWIGMVVCDFYPLEEETRNPGATPTSVIEKTDIGGPTMIRSGAKGRRIVVCDASDRQLVLDWLRAGEPDREDFVNKLAAKAEFVISRYCAISSEYHSGGKHKAFFGNQIYECSYGENAWQKDARVYASQEAANDPLAISNWGQIAGDPMSYNNFCDLDRMLQTMTHAIAGFDENLNFKPAIAIGVKHGNACSAAFNNFQETALKKMLTCDPRAIFGGSVMVNFPVDHKLAELLIGYNTSNGKRALDLIAAPSFDGKAIEILAHARKKKKCRLVTNPALNEADRYCLDRSLRFRHLRGGFITQPNYTFVPELKDVNLILAWAVGSTSNSNTITIVKGGMLYGNGVGQQDRVGAAKLAIQRADDVYLLNGSKTEGIDEGEANLEGAVAYSDSFFPFTDGLQALLNRGIKKVFATFGSVRDAEIAQLCEKYEVELIGLPDREGRGFYGR